MFKVEFHKNTRKGEYQFLPEKQIINTDKCISVNNALGLLFSSKQSQTYFGKWCQGSGRFVKKILYGSETTILR